MTLSVPKPNQLTVTRCTWGISTHQMQAYHDIEWGVPVRGSQDLFAKLLLDGFQAGLSWQIVLRKREGIHKAFDNFDPHKLARYNAAKLKALENNPAIIRNRAKIKAAVSNAKAYLDLEEGGTEFCDFIWSFTDGATLQNRWRTMKSVPAETKESKAMAKALRSLGFRFCGPTICYAFMQAVGMVNDHLVTCFRHSELARENKSHCRNIP